MSHLQVILRAEIVESVQAGDRYDFTGTLIVVPDVGALAAPGNYIREHELVHKKKFKLNSNNIKNNCTLKLKVGCSRSA